VRRAAKRSEPAKVFVSGDIVFRSEGHPTNYEYSLEELCAIVEEVQDRGTYIMGHVYTDEGVHRCLLPGLGSI